MRQKYDPQSYFSWIPESRSKTVREYENKYNRISLILDENRAILDLVDRELKKLCRPGRKGRKAIYTTEILLRAMIVHHLEGQSLRDTEIMLSHNVFLQDRPQDPRHYLRRPLSPPTGKFELGFMALMFHIVAMLCSSSRCDILHSSSGQGLPALKCLRYVFSGQ